MPDADKAKEALKRDWEQTKADMPGDSGRDHGQSIGDTVRQAMGKDDDADRTDTARRTDTGDRTDTVGRTDTVRGADTVGRTDTVRGADTVGRTDTVRGTDRTS